MASSSYPMPATMVADASCCPCAHGVGLLGSFDEPQFLHARQGRGADYIALFNAELNAMERAFATTLPTPMISLAMAIRDVWLGKTISQQDMFNLQLKAILDGRGFQGICIVSTMLQVEIQGIPNHRQLGMALLKIDDEQRGCLLAKMMMAVEMEDGSIGVPVDKRRALSLYEEVLKVVPLNFAMVKLGGSLLAGTVNGKGVIMRAAKLFHKAICNGGNPDAMYHFACILSGHHGCNVKQDYARAIRLFHGAIHDGTDALRSAAMVKMGQCFVERHNGVTQNFALAQELFESAISLDGNLDAMVDLGLLYWEDRTSAENGGLEAVRLFEAAAEQGCVKAMQTLAPMLWHGNVYVLKNETRAVQFYENLLKLSPSPRHRVDLALKLNSVAEKNGNQAMKNRSRELVRQVYTEVNDPDTLCNLANLMSEYKVISHRFWKRAADLYRQAYSVSRKIEDGVKLAMIHATGRLSVDRHSEMSSVILSAAVAAGYKQYMFSLACALEDEVQCGRGDISKALSAYESVIREQDHMVAMINLSILLSSGRSTLSVNYPRALELLERAASIGLHDNRGQVSTLGFNPPANLKHGHWLVNMRKDHIRQGRHLVAAYYLGITLIKSQQLEGFNRATQLIEFVSTRTAFAPEVLPTHARRFKHELHEVSKEGFNRSRLDVVRWHLYELMLGTERVCAIRKLALLYIQGSECVAKDKIRGLRLLRSAVDQGDRESMVTLGELLYRYNVQGRGSVNKSEWLFARALCGISNDRENGRISSTTREAMLHLARIGERYRRRRRGRRDVRQETPVEGRVEKKRTKNL